jgi:hypothetical protein
MKPRFVSRSLLDQLRSFVRERCPCALEDKTFFPTFVAIVDCEMEKVVEETREKPRRNDDPSPGDKRCPT